VLVTGVVAVATLVPGVQTIRASPLTALPER